MSDQERIDELSKEAIGGVTEAVAAEVYELLGHDDEAVARRAFGVFEYGPADGSEDIDYDRVARAAAGVLRDDPEVETELAMTVCDTLTFVVDEHAPGAVDVFEERDREWATALSGHDIPLFRELGCAALGGIGGSAARDRLETVAETDDAESVRQAAQRALDRQW